MSNTMKNARLFRRRDAKLVLRLRRSRRIPRLQAGTRPKPPQPTIISLHTARGLAYLENRDLARFDDSRLIADSAGVLAGTGIAV